LDLFDSENRRQNSRIRFNNPVQFSLKSPLIYQGSLACDIGDGGLRLKVNDFIPNNTPICLTFRLSTERCIDCEAQVAWSKKEAFSDRYEVGLKIDDENIEPLSKELIQKYIASHKSNNH